ncbi:type II toxin-antitoxin system RelE/ParE family toxin [Sphingobium limneticum]|jgi:toxin ParE1/3/4|uniref:Type II toxin-antitoxin system RelE/ParE family toxin n=1 Tax=Sphingobium limneticum TaxID=1007511 RepID=A0A5J5I7I1_9SPHN|nr:type II toxin-antitoxin system RelE/ParE family toxin [Sphingobium limneticum]KAA9019592.1 type II toxin-antitoxin system RelE/ParE family toxin [Sphingobium limneticum]KAA9032050.1 type II toxin-antitoxin system RelE/ParE family toxin [Sphingobium limneticum]
MTEPVYPVQLADTALDDLAAIRSHIAEQRSPEEADRLVDHLLDRMAMLRTFPLRGGVPNELDALGVRDYRQLLSRPYRIIYHFDDKVVDILMIADGRRDMQTLLTHRLLASGPK